MNLEWILLGLAVLACPLIMWWMMRGGYGGAHGQGGADTEEEIRALQARLTELESRAAKEPL